MARTLDMSRDVFGRPYASVKKTKAGDRVRTDNAFTCIAPRQQRVILRCRHGLFITCRDGKHLIDGQLSDDGKSYVGLYPITA